MNFVIETFLCYAHNDREYLNKLKAHLRTLTRQGRINIWDDSYIVPGLEWESEIEDHIDTAEIILLLISPDFMNSDRCHDEMMRAMKRRRSGDARVVPIILRYVHWQDSPLGRLQALPTDAKPITSWGSEDEAFFDVVEGIRKIIEQLAPLLYQKYLNMEQADKAVNEISDQGPFNPVTCPRCSGKNLAGEPFTDLSRGEIAYRIICRECGWVGKMTGVERKA